jgi:hypothetical protein
MGCARTAHALVAAVVLGAGAAPLEDGDRRMSLVGEGSPGSDARRDR